MFMVGGLVAGSGWFWRGAGGGVARPTSAAGAGCRGAGLMISVLNSAAISLRVSGICSAGGRMAAMLGGGGDGEERQGEHGQGGPPVPGVPSGGPGARPARSSPLPAWKFSSVVQLVPATLTRAGSGHVPGGVAAVERQFAGVAVAADQQPVVTGLAGVDGHPGPVVVAVALGALAGGVPLPGPAGQAARRSSRAWQVPAAVVTGGWRPPPARNRPGGVPGQRAGHGSAP